MISLTHVSKSYSGKDHPLEVLRDINLTINDLDSVAIVGQSGAGKSTLIRIINGLVKKSSGEVIIDDQNLDTLSEKGLLPLRHQIGMVFQHFNLLNQVTVAQNIRYVLEFQHCPKSLIPEKIAQVLKEVGLSEKANNYPSTLSGGEKQRVGIARAIVNHPKYLLLDEITSALDTKTSHEIIDLLLKLQNDYRCTIIFISHQLDIAKELCNRFVMLENGTIASDCTTLELFINPPNQSAKDLVESVIESKTSGIPNAYRLIFLDSNTTEPLMANVAHKFPESEISILFARKIKISQHEIGYLDIQIKGDIPAILQYIRSRKIEVQTR
jgi:D-methionine transport system ATP-binding protein